MKVALRINTTTVVVDAEPDGGPLTPDIEPHVVYARGSTGWALTWVRVGPIGGCDRHGDLPIYQQTDALVCGPSARISADAILEAYAVLPNAIATAFDRAIHTARDVETALAWAGHPTGVEREKFAERACQYYGEKLRAANGLYTGRESIDDL